MSQQPENLRVRRTRKLLRESLVDLIELRGFDHVTVAEITERAMVSRAAFYRNYRDKFHLVEQIFDDAIAELTGAMADADQRPVRERLVSFFDHIGQYHRFYGALLGRNGSPWFQERMRTTLSDLASGHAPADPGRPSVAAAAASPRPPDESLSAAMLSAVFVQTITWWLANDRPCSPREIANRYARIATLIINDMSAEPSR
ncbi:MAG TPA: TetR/AcrR family transcriptional regulator [Actinocrinis sp.]|nr:TetR/AcrR family transcriptional regulator [Actinocrinis sp.]